MYRCKKPVYLILDSLPAHKRAIVSEYVASTEGRLTLYFLPGYAPDLNPDELVWSLAGVNYLDRRWSHLKRTGAARLPLQKGETPREKIEAAGKDPKTAQLDALILQSPIFRLYWRLVSKEVTAM